MKHINFNLNFAKRGAYTPPCNSHLLLSIFMLFAMLMPVKVWGKAFFLNTNSHTFWENESAHFVAAYTLTTNESNWIITDAAVKIADHIFCVTIPDENVKKIRFRRVNPNDHNNQWNPSAEYNYESSKNCIRITGWDNSSVYETYNYICPSKMYVVGGACDGGWGNFKEFTTVSTGVYRWTGKLTNNGDNDNSCFKFTSTGNYGDGEYRAEVNQTKFVLGQPYKLVKGGDDRKFMVTNTDIYTITIDLTNPANQIMTITKDYYIGGRFGFSKDEWGTNHPMTYDSESGYYKYETGKTVAQLSAQLDAATQYFIVHTGMGSTGVWYSGTSSQGHGFQAKKGEANAYSMTKRENTTQDESRRFIFNNTSDNNGPVTIWFDATGDTKKVWYTVPEACVAPTAGFAAKGQFNAGQGSPWEGVATDAGSNAGQNGYFANDHRTITLSTSITAGLYEWEYVAGSNEYGDANIESWTGKTTKKATATVNLPGTYTFKCKAKCSEGDAWVESQTVTIYVPYPEIGVSGPFYSGGWGHAEAGTTGLMTRNGLVWTKTFNVTNANDPFCIIQKHKFAGPLNGGWDGDTEPNYRGNKINHGTNHLTGLNGGNGSDLTQNIGANAGESVTLTVVMLGYNEYNITLAKEVTATTYYIKHSGWAANGTDWDWKELDIDNHDGTYSYEGIYKASGCNWSAKADHSDSKWIPDTDTKCIKVNSPVSGDNCTFMLNPTAGTITITKKAVTPAYDDLTSNYYFRGDLWLDGNGWISENNRDTDLPKFIKAADNKSATLKILQPDFKIRFTLFESSTKKQVNSYWNAEETAASNITNTKAGQATDNSVFNNLGSTKMITYTLTKVAGALHMTANADDYTVKKAGWKLYVDGTEVGTTDVNGEVTVQNLNGEHTFYFTDGSSAADLRWGVNKFGGLYVDQTNSESELLSPNKQYYKSSSIGTYEAPISNTSGNVGYYDATGSINLTSNSDVKFAFDGGKITINKVAASTLPDNLYVYGCGGNFFTECWKNNLPAYKMTVADGEATYTFNNVSGSTSMKIRDHEANVDRDKEYITEQAQNMTTIIKSISKGSGNNNIDLSLNGVANLTIHYDGTKIWFTAERVATPVAGNEWYIMGSGNSWDWNKGTKTDHNRMTITDGVASVSYTGVSGNLAFKVFRGSDNAEFNCSYYDAEASTGKKFSNLADDNICLNGLTHADVTIYWDGAKIWTNVVDYQTITDDYYLRGWYDGWDQGWVNNKFTKVGDYKQTFTLLITPSTESNTNAFKATQSGWKEMITYDNVDQATCVNYTKATDGDQRIYVNPEVTSRVTFIIWKDADGNRKMSIEVVPAQTHTVTYQNGPLSTTREVANGEKATALSMAHRGVEVDWYDNEACTGSTFDFANTPITEDKTLYAKSRGANGNYFLTGAIWHNWTNENKTPQMSVADGVATYTFVAPVGQNTIRTLRGSRNESDYIDARYFDETKSSADIKISGDNKQLYFTISDKPKQVTVTFDGAIRVQIEDYTPHYVDNLFLTTNGNWCKVWQANGTQVQTGSWDKRKEANKLRQNGTIGYVILRDVTTGEHLWKLIGNIDDDSRSGEQLFNAMYVDYANSVSAAGNFEWNMTNCDALNRQLSYESNEWRNVRFNVKKVCQLKIVFDGGLIKVMDLPQYTVTFNTDGGSAVAPQTLYEEERAGKPADPTKSGYSFLGWEYNGEDFSFDTPITGDITLSAIWEEKGCQSYTFHYGPNAGEWAEPAEPLCFEKKDGADHEWQIENFVIDPSMPYYFVGYQGDFYNDNLGNANSRSAKKSFSEEMYLVMSMNSDDAAGSPKVGAANGAIGTLRIYDNSNWNNLYVGFNPAGYGMMYGANATEKSIAINATSNPAVYVSDEITLTTDILNSKYQVGLLRNGGGYVACDNSAVNDVTSIGSCYWNGSDMVWPGDLTHYSAGDKGRIRIWVDNVNKNWLCNFVPTWRLTFDMNGVSATAPAAIEKYSEDSEADRTVDVSTIIPTNVSGHKLFVGWYTEAEGGDKVENPFVLQSNKTLYAHWEELPTPCSYLRKGEYLYLDLGAQDWTVSGAVLAAFFYDEQGHVYNGGDATEPQTPANMSQFFTLELVSGSTYRVAVPENFLVAIQVCRMSNETSDNGTGRWIWTKGPKLDIADAIEEGYNCVHLTSYEGGVWSTYGTPRTTQCLNLQELIDITEQDGTLTLHTDYADESGTIKEGKTITINGGSHTIGDLTVTTTGNLTVGNNLTVNNFYLQANGASHTSGQVLSPENINVAGDAFFDLTLENEHIQYGWYDFCVPFAVDVMSGITGIDHESGEENTFTNGVDYAVMEHQGALQALGQYPYKKFTGTMQPSRLYTITLDDDYNYSTIRFRKASGADLVSGNSVELYAYSGDETHANWNGVGNGTLHHADAGVSVEYVQVYNTGDKTFSAKRTDEVSLVVGTAVMVQATGTMTLSESASHPLLAPARVAAEASETYAIELRQEATQRADRLFYSASEEAEGEYTIGSDLLKAGNIGNVQVPQLWINAFGQKLCVHQAEIIDQQAESSLSLYAPVAGEYTLEITNMPDSENELYLTEDGRPIWNLTQSAVTLDLESGINSKYGLRIVVQPVQTVVTDLWGAKQQGAETFKYIDRGILYLRANGRTIDATGCVVR